MSREPFYEIKPDAYLFSGRLSKSVNQRYLEEPIRQWCAFELIRAYGVRIDDLNFEERVRVGSRNPRIDILVSRKGKPWLVVECKKNNKPNPNEGMSQAITYANMESIRAPFALYTNGSIWHVQRRVNGKWHAVPDLPPLPREKKGEPLIEILRACYTTFPILYKLHEKCKQKEVRKFLIALQKFFNGNSLFCRGLDYDLLKGTDNLLRVLVKDFEDMHYRHGKLSVALSAYEKFRESSALKSPIPNVCVGASIADNCQTLYACLSSITEEANDLGGLDLALLNLNVSLARYGMQQSKKIPFPSISLDFSGTLRRFLEASFALNMNAYLPEENDHISLGDMAKYCRSAWEREDEDKISFREWISAIGALITSPFNRD